MKKVTRNILSLIIIAIATIAIQGCKKTSDPAPQTITKTIHDTIKSTYVLSVQYDTLYCIHRDAIIGTWYCYATSQPNAPKQDFIPVKYTFTHDTLLFDNVTKNKISYNSDFSIIYYQHQNDSIAFNLSVSECNELKFYNTSNHVTSYLRNHL